MIYPEKLIPNASETFEIKDHSVVIPKCKVDFMKWAGTPLSYTFGGKPIVDHKGIPMFAEMAILNNFKDDGWDGRWGGRRSGSRIYDGQLSDGGMAVDINEDGSSELDL